MLKHLKNFQFLSMGFVARKMAKIYGNIWKTVNFFQLVLLPLKWAKSAETYEKLSFFNTFTGKLFSENHRFSLKIFKTLKRSRSVNFDRTRKLQTFLEPSDSVLSETNVFWHSISNRKMSRAANVRKSENLFNYEYSRSWLALNVLMGFVAKKWPKSVETSKKLSFFSMGFVARKNGQNLLKHLKSCHFLQ